MYYQLVLLLDTVSVFFHSLLQESSPSFSAYAGLIIGLALFGFSAFVSSSETAFFALKPQDIEALEQSESATDKLILTLLENQQRLLATILIVNNFVNIVIIVLLTQFTSALFDFSQSPIIGFLVQTVIITFLLLLFGEIMPKVFATLSPIKVVRFTARGLSVMQRICLPLVKILVKSTSAVNTRLHRHAKTNISIDELSQALELTSGEQNDDKEMLEGIIKFGNIKVADIMRSRLDMVDVDIKWNYKELMKVIIESGYSRLPVYSGTRDTIKGVIYSKDLLPYLDKPHHFRWQTLIRAPYFVPESKKLDDLLREFQENKMHLAIVVDEYGGTSGLISLEDILEEIVGDIKDEYDEEEKLFTKVDDHTFIFEGKTLLNDFYKIIDTDDAIFGKTTDEVETLAGLLLELKGEMPALKERITCEHFVFEVMAVDKRRIKSIKVTITEPKKEERDEDK